MGDPIVVFGEVPASSLSPTSPRYNVILKHPSKTAMLVEEIRFYYTVPGAAARDGDYWNAIDLLRVKIKVGNWDVTEGDVPVNALGVLTDPLQSWSSGLTPTLAVGSVTWKLPKPLYLPRNGQITFDFGMFNDLIDPSAMPDVGTLTLTNVGVAITGQALTSQDAPQNKVFMPYARSWMAPTALPDAALLPAVVGGSIDAQSNASDLKNTKPYPLNLNYMTILGMVGYTPITSGTYVLADALTLTAAGLDVPLIAGTALGMAVGVPQTGIRMQLADTRGGFVIRDPAPIASVFNMTERAWRMNCVLAPQQYFIATLSGGWSAWTDPGMVGDPAGIGLRLTFTLLGYHEIPIADMGVAL